MKFTARHIFPLIVIIIFGMMFFSYAESLYRQYQRDEYKKDLEKEIETLHTDVTDLEKLLEYVQMDEYKELKAKETLGQKLPDEVVIAVPPHPDSSKEIKAEEIPLSERPAQEQWWVYFFGEE